MDSENQPSSDIKKQDNIKFQKQKFEINNHHQIDESGANIFNRFVNTIHKDVNNFLSRFFGSNYVPRNDFSLGQKQKILRYIYQNNDNKKLQYKDKTFKYEEIDDLYDTPQVIDVKNQIKKLKKIESQNRIIYIQEIAECQNRIRYSGFMWGTFMSSILWGTVFKNYSIIKKTAMFLSLFHLGGQIASFRSIDQVFDSIYPIFDRDVDEFLKDEKQKQNNLLNHGIKKDITQQKLDLFRKEFYQNQRKNTYQQNKS